MKNIIESFGTLYPPVKALVWYRKNYTGTETYLEAYDIGDDGCMRNAHPLSFKESSLLALALDSSEELKTNYLKSKGLIPDNVLFIHPGQEGFVIWHTPAQSVNLYFAESLTIPSGKAALPPLLWQATKEQLYIFALDSDGKPHENADLFRAPFFNIYWDGRVCMGTVKIQIDPTCCLEEFITTWEKYFFNSYFSHLLGGSPVKGNIVQLWQGLVDQNKNFPPNVLIKINHTIKDLLS